MAGVQRVLGEVERVEDGADQGRLADGSRLYDTNGKLVLRDPGQIRFAVDIDYDGTPSDPNDDIGVPDSFRIVRPSTGGNDAEGRDFGADLAEFTS
jgi:hypothetical protein